LGSQGGFVAASDDVTDLLVNEARSFVYSTGLSPVDASVAHRAVEIVRSEAGDELRSRLERNVEHLGDALEDAGFDVRRESHILPVIIGDAEDALEVSRRLEENGVFAPAIRPPTVPEGTSRIRVTPTAKHSHDEIETVVEAFRRAGRRAEVVA
ncbi:MAG: aminotransferase class I/II-fold pyridoxal phosphate-dependent enzyme, partial [Halobacteria archaeon]|nr:aminotransferase class I/II-fold pyridoxal phosphate-dependent enzyme [Halobacteria archaeon]